MHFDGCLMAVFRLFLCCFSAVFVLKMMTLEGRRRAAGTERE